MKKQNPNASIPEFNEYTDYKTIAKAYDLHSRQIKLDSSVETYKTYLTGGFVLFEWILENMFHFKAISGFAKSQMDNMSSYDKLLIELGEKSYISAYSNLPVEIRLCGMIVINSVFFVASKMIISNTMNASTYLPHTQQSPQQVKKPKMREPDLSEFTSLKNKI